MKTESIFFLMALFHFMPVLVSCSKNDSVADQFILKSGSEPENVPVGKNDNVSVTISDFGPDGALYISNPGFGLPMGQILRVVF